MNEEFDGVEVVQPEPPPCGPAWETDGYSFRSWWQTVVGVWRSPWDGFFKTMSTDGGYTKPLMFSWITTALVILAMWPMVLFVTGQMLDNFTKLELFPVLTYSRLLTWWTMFCFIGVMLHPLYLYICAALAHVFLVLCGGANRGFQATFSVVCYIQGATVPLNLVPNVGPLVLWISDLVLTVVGLYQVHRTTLPRVIISRVIAMFLLSCCTCMLGFGCVALYGDTLQKLVPKPAPRTAPPTLVVQAQQLLAP